jgi:hypothetical protein
VQARSLPPPLPRVRGCLLDLQLAALQPLLLPLLLPLQAPVLAQCVAHHPPRGLLLAALAAAHRSSRRLQLQPQAVPALLHLLQLRVARVPLRVCKLRLQRSSRHGRRSRPWRRCSCSCWSSRSGSGNDSERRRALQLRRRVEASAPPLQPRTQRASASARPV